MASHFVLLTNDAQRRYVAYSDVAPFTWWAQAYGKTSKMPPKTIETDAHGFPVHMIGCSAAVVDEFLKIFTGVMTLEQAWKGGQPAGYSILQWRRCLSKHGLVSENKKREREEEEEDEEETVSAPLAKKKKTSKEPILNPIEEREWKIGTAFGKFVLANHPRTRSFASGDGLTSCLCLDVVVPAADITARRPVAVVPHYTVELPELGEIDMVKQLCSYIDLKYEPVFLRAMCDVIHALAQAQVYRRFGSTGVQMAGIFPVEWPASELAPNGYEWGTVDTYRVEITYKAYNDTKRKKALICIIVSSHKERIPGPMMDPHAGLFP